MTTAEATEKTLPRLKQRYREEIRDTLLKEFGYANVMNLNVAFIYPVYHFPVNL